MQFIGQQLTITQQNEPTNHDTSMLLALMNNNLFLPAYFSCIVTEAAKGWLVP